MARYKVMLTGLKGGGKDARERFLGEFASAYNMSPERARELLKKSRGVVYEYDDRESAEWGKRFIESIGGTAEVSAETGRAEGVEQARSRSSGPECPAPPPPVAVRPLADPPSRGAFLYPGHFVRSYTLGPLLDALVEIYRFNWAALILLQFLQAAVAFTAVLVIGAAAAAAGFTADTAAGIVAPIIAASSVVLPPAFYAVVYLYCAQALGVSVMIRGRRPGVMDCLRMTGLEVPLKLLATQFLILLVVAGLAAPLVLFIALAARDHPGAAVLAGLLMMVGLLLAGALFLMAVPAVVVEDRWSVGGMSRSIELGRGRYFRNFGVILLVTLVVLVIGLFVGGILSLIPLAGWAAAQAVQLALAPLPLVALMLLYYDMQAKKGLVNPLSQASPPAPVRRYFSPPTRPA